MIITIGSFAISNDFSTGQFLTIKSKSLTLTLVILESLDPLMSQLSITSHKARWFLSKKFSSLQLFVELLLEIKQLKLSKNDFEDDDKNLASLDFTDGKDPRIRILESWL